MECILIIDSDELLLLAITRALHTYCPEIKAVSTGDEALQEISSRFYHLVFMDIALPGLRGPQVLKKIREISPDTKIVVMTSAQVDDEMRRDLEDHAFRILAKPFEISELKEAAREALARPDEESYPFPRRAKRIPRKKTVHYSMTVLELGRPVSLSLKGDMIDVSHMGVGLRTYYPLEAGHLLMFNSGFDPSEQKTGIVRWSAVTDESYMYRVGVEFIQP